MSKFTIGKGVAYLYIEAISIMFSSYIYWLILSQIASPAVIGTSSAVISLVNIFIVVASLGVSNGIQSFLAKNIADKKIENIRGIINSSLLIVIVGITGSTMFILIFSDWIYDFFTIDYILAVVSILIVGFSVSALLFRAIIVPTLNTKVIAISAVISTIIKVSVTVVLILINTGVFGILFGYMLYPIISTIILAIAMKKTLYGQKSTESKTISFFVSIKDISMASISFWIPNVVNTIGAQLGTVAVYISAGTSHAAIYFISFSVIMGISLILSVLSTIAYPTISSMQDGRKTATWRLVKLSLILTLPMSIFLIFYSKDVLALFGSIYTTGSSSLEILLLSVLPSSLIIGISVLVYAYGNNRQVLIIGLFMSIPRTLLYFISVPMFGINGAALTYLLGAISGCIISLIIANKVGMKIFWKQIFLILIIPTLIAFLLKYTNMHYIVGIFGTVAISYILFLGLRLINKEDIQDILKILPKSLSKPINTIILKLFNKSARP